MGQAVSATFGECLGSLTDTINYSRAPSPPRRVELASSSANASTSKMMRSRRPQSLSGIPSCSAIPPPPPPLVPDKNAVYNLVDDEEVCCPVCLEEYTPDNPKITSECGHSYHLQCLLEWETRSGASSCPMCGQTLKYREASA